MQSFEPDVGSDILSREFGEALLGYESRGSGQQNSCPAFLPKQHGGVVGCAAGMEAVGGMKAGDPRCIWELKCIGREQEAFGDSACIKPFAEMTVMRRSVGNAR
jgi:hypothetical protein